MYHSPASPAAAAADITREEVGAGLDDTGAGDADSGEQAAHPRGGFEDAGHVAPQEVHAAGGSADAYQGQAGESN